MTLPSGSRSEGVVVVLSDMFDNVPAILAGLKHFRHRRHEVIVFQVLDPAELDFPFTDDLQGPGSLPQVLADPRTLRKAYLNEFHRFLPKFAKGVANNELITCHCEPTSDWMSRFRPTWPRG